MKLIAKRGLFEGPNPETENTVKQIQLALSKGYWVEVDIWKINNEWFIGHDVRKRSINLNKTFAGYFDKIYFHCKNQEAYDGLESNSNNFIHNEENYAITSKGEKWQHGNFGKSVYCKRLNGDWEKVGIYRDNFKIKHVFLDWDGSVAGSKYYNESGQCIMKSVKDSSFTAIKRMKTAGLNVHVISADSWNEGICKVRGIDFIKSDTLGSNSKLNKIIELVGSEIEQSCFLLDDYYDLPAARYTHSYCPNDAIDEVKLECTVLKSDSGGNVVADMYEDLIKKGLVRRVAPLEG